MDKSNAVLEIYLNDHLGGATMGVELFRRASRSAQGSVKTQLQELTTEVERDRESLRTLMGTLAVPVHRYKVLGGWVLEKAARLKPNGRLLRRSPLSDLIELEGLLLGVQGKAAGFRTLRRLADTRLQAGRLRVTDRSANCCTADKRPQAVGTGRFLGLGGVNFLRADSSERRNGANFD